MTITRGPWETFSYSRHEGLVIAKHLRIIVDRREDFGDPADDTRLVAAAPTLLKALKKITAEARSWHDFHHGSDIVQCDSICECLKDCEAAIAKAEKQ